MEKNIENLALIIGKEVGNFALINYSERIRKNEKYLKLSNCRERI